MGGSPWNGILPEYAVRQIRRKARKLVGRYGFTRSDQGDIEEELAISVWRRLPEYDPTKGGLEAFLYWLIKRARHTLIERQTAAKRGGGSRPWSLDRTIRGPDGTPSSAAAVTQQSEARRRLNLAPEHFTATSDRRMALEAFLKGLDGELRGLCLRLMDGQSFTDIHLETGISRGSLYDRRAKLLQLMRQAGLRKYHPSSGASARPPVGEK